WYALFKLLCFFFFFSSRRRHTRSKRDWSSDVCSSDLSPLSLENGMLRGSPQARNTSGSTSSSDPESVPCARAPSGHAAASPHARSEERRVGKEWRSRWARDREKKNERSKSTRRGRDE